MPFDATEAARLIAEAENKMRYCHAGTDGECNWPKCPQNRDNEPEKTGRDCPLIWLDDED